MTKLSFLTSLSCGVHSPRRCPYRALFPDHENKRFVIISLREEPLQVDGRFGKAVQQVVNNIWDKNNPFSWSDDSPAYRVVALEVEWSAIVGIDYRCPLHDDGKLVLEVRHAVKRCFKTVEDARDFYSSRPADHAGELRTSISATPTPSKVSFDGRCLALSTIRSVHVGAGSLSPRFARPIGCGIPSYSTAVRQQRDAETGLTANVGVVCNWVYSGSSGYAQGNRRLSLEHATSRSVSATRVLPKATVFGGYAAGSHVAASNILGGSYMDFASADEREAPNCHRRAVAVGATRGVPPEAQRAASVAARRRLHLRAVESMPVAGQVEQSGGCAKAEAVMQRLRMRGRCIPQKYLDASSRKVRSASDLCGMAASDSLERERAGGSLVAAGAANVAHSSSVWSSSLATSCARTATAQSRDHDSLDHHSYFRSHGSEGCGGYDGHVGGVCCSNSVESPRAAFLLQQQQQQMTEEIHARQRRGASHSLRSHISCKHFGYGCVGDTAREARGGRGGRVPPASRWTQPSATYYSKTLVLGFRDPFLPQELRRFVKSDMRLLKLYESGLPPWAVFMPCYGLPYRPWLRRALWLLFIAISIFSMGCGFYDLYKNVPFLKQVVTAVASRMYLPASELFEWLERHTQIRMSILLTYLFSKSPLLMSLMRMLRNLAALLQQLLRPAVAALSAAVQPLLSALQFASASVGGRVAAAFAAVWRVAQPLLAAAAVSGAEVLAFAALVLGPPARALWAMAILLAQLFRLVAALIGMILIGPLQFACSIGEFISWVGAAAAERLAVVSEVAMSMLQWLLTLGRAARRAGPAVKAGARLASHAVGGVAGGGSSAGGLSGGMAVWHWLGLEVVGAYNAVRLTFMQAFKSAKAVMNFCVTVAQTAVQHRVSLLLQLRRFITRQKERLPPAVAASVPLPSFVNLPSFPNTPVYALPSPDHGTDLDDEPRMVVNLPASPSEHPLYDMDMVLGSSDDDSHLMVSDSQHLYSSSGTGALMNDSGSRSAEPIRIPHGGLVNGMRRRHVGAPARRLALGGDGSGSLRYGMYDALRQRLDAVDEELEGSQHLNNGESSRAEDAWGKAGEGEPHTFLGSWQRRPARDIQGSSWSNHNGIRTDVDPGMGFESGSYLRYASAPVGATNRAEGCIAGYRVQPDLSSPSWGKRKEVDFSALSRSMPSSPKLLAQQPAVAQQLARSRKQKQQVHHRQRQQQRRPPSALDCSGLLPPGLSTDLAAGGRRAVAADSHGSNLGQAKGHCDACAWAEAPTVVPTAQQQ